MTDVLVSTASIGLDLVLIIAYLLTSVDVQPKDVCRVGPASVLAKEVQPTRLFAPVPPDNDQPPAQLHTAPVAAAQPQPAVSKERLPLSQQQQQAAPVNAPADQQQDMPQKHTTVAAQEGKPSTW